MNKQSKRFIPSKWMEKMVPVLFVLLVLVLLVTFGIIIFSFF